MKFFLFFHNDFCSDIYFIYQFEYNPVNICKPNSIRQGCQLVKIINQKHWNVYKMFQTSVSLMAECSESLLLLLLHGWTNFFRLYRYSYIHNCNKNPKPGFRPIFLIRYTNFRNISYTSLKLFWISDKSLKFWNSPQLNSTFIFMWLRCHSLLIMTNSFLINLAALNPQQLWKHMQLLWLENFTVFKKKVTLFSINF